MEALISYHYPGNVRELENIVERAVTLENERWIQKESLPGWLLNPDSDRNPVATSLVVPAEGLDLEGYLSDFEKDILQQTLALTNGHRTEAARLLGISFRSLRYKLDKYSMNTTE
jgi:two-component system response regulator PilR (NtrC family)